MIIGLYGPQGAGKSTIATLLEDEFGWEKVSFAATIRRAVKAIWPEEVRNEDKNAPFVYGLSHREVLQKVGAFARREINPDIWVDACLDRVKDGQLTVIDDLRYDNEREKIEERSGIIIRIDSDQEIEQHNNHESEKDWPLWTPDLQFTNNFDDELSPEKIAGTIERTLSRKFLYY